MPLFELTFGTDDGRDFVLQHRAVNQAEARNYGVELMGGEGSLGKWHDDCDANLVELMSVTEVVQTS